MKKTIIVIGGDILYRGLFFNRQPRNGYKKPGKSHFTSNLLPFI